MIRILATAILLLACSLPAAASVADIADSGDARRAFEAAAAAYAQEDFDTALAGFRALERAGFGSREVLLNAGNAAHKLGRAGEAVLYYERALRLDPAYRAAADNLARVEPQTNRVENEGFGVFLGERFARTPGWLWVALSLLGGAWFAAGIVGLARSLPGTEQRLAWWGRAASAAVGWAILVSLVIGHGIARQAPREAVVMADRTSIRPGPGTEFRQQLELPAGTVVELVGDAAGDWTMVRLRDGRAGYLPIAEIEGI